MSVQGVVEDQLLDVEDPAPMEELVEGVAVEEQVVDQQVGRM